MKNILVWDWPVRIGHWLLVAAFATAWLTGESETWKLVHVAAGGAVVGDILFRLLWGVVGTRHARFGAFVRGPRAVAAYVRGILRGQSQHTTGHNAAGGWAIVGLLALGLLAGATGWAAYQEIGGEWLEELHEGLTTAMLGLVAVHVVGVIVSSRAHGENLAKAMVTGHKRGAPQEAIARAYGPMVLVQLAWIGACAWWFTR